MISTSTSDLVLTSKASIDLQIHTTYSDGSWSPVDLLDHLAREQFALVAITDHDRPDTAATLQQLALAKHLPVLVAAEMTTTWRGQMVDVLCFGFRLDQHALTEVAQDLAHRQQENTREVYHYLCHTLQLIAEEPQQVQALVEMPTAQQPHALVKLVEQYLSDSDKKTAGKIVLDAGCSFATNDIGIVVDAAHRSGAVCIIAHPGRDNGFLCFTPSLLDELRDEVPIDGLEVYYPVHTPEQVDMYRDYARKHRLLISAGSDSHDLAHKPVKYRADLAQGLLEQIGIQFR